MAALLLLLTGCGSLVTELDREAAPAGGPSASPSPTPSYSGGVRAETPDPGVQYGATPSTPAEPYDTALPAPRPSTPAPAPTDCPEAGARLTMDLVNAAMGLRATSVTLTNCGPDTYKLNGYPSIRVQTADGTLLDVQVLQGTSGITTSDDPGPHPVTLKPGESARTDLYWRNTVIDGTESAVNADCISLALTDASAGPRQTLCPSDGPFDLGTTGKLGTTAWQRYDPNA
jgi:hypothetical protein